jgi:hypothetical protein
MDRPSRDAARRRSVAASPHLQCRGCGLPISLAAVEREGARRSLTCPFCDQCDEWAVEAR